MRIAADVVDRIDAPMKPQTETPLSSKPPLRPRSRRVLFFELVALLLVVLVLVVMLFWRFLILMGIAMAMALILKPAHVWLARKLGGRPGVAALIIVLLVTAVILIPLLGGLAAIAAQTLNFYEWVTPYLTVPQLERVWKEILPARLPWLSHVQDMGQSRVADFLSAALSRFASGANNLLQGAVAGLTSAALELTLLLITLYFFLRDGPYFRAQIRRVSPLTSSQMDEMLDQIAQTMQGALASLLLVPVVHGIVATVGYLLFGVPNALLWGGLTTLVAFVPALGTPIAWVPICIYLFVQGEVWQAIGLAVYCTLLVAVADNILRAWMLKGSAKIHPLWSFFAILSGLFTFGALGLLVGPLILSLGVSALHIYEMDVLRGPDIGSRNLPDNTTPGVPIARAPG